MQKRWICCPQYLRQPAKTLVSPRLWSRTAARSWSIYGSKPSPSPGETVPPMSWWSWRQSSDFKNFNLMSFLPGVCSPSGSLWADAARGGCAACSITLTLRTTTSLLLCTSHIQVHFFVSSHLSVSGVNSCFSQTQYSLSFRCNKTTEKGHNMRPHCSCGVIQVSGRPDIQIRLVMASFTPGC